MDRTALYHDMMERTQGDIYFGVIGPVRTGKSTFIKRFAELLMVPNIENEFQRQRLVDELPQSGNGKSIMTTQPKFIPEEAEEVRLDETSTARMRLVDCVGYIVPGAIGSEEEGVPRMVTTPWFDEDIPFEQAAEIGTRKVITDHATVGIVVLTDGTITEIPRENYLEAEQKCMDAVRETGKPFIVLLNSADPNGDPALHAAEEIEEQYGIRPMIVDLLHLSERSLTNLLSEVLFAFPLKMIELNGPSFLRALPSEHPVLKQMIETLSGCVQEVHCVRDVQRIAEAFSGMDLFQSAEVQQISLGTGRASLGLHPNEGVFYSILSDACGMTIRNDYELMSAVNGFVTAKKAYDRLSAALDKAMQTGYGIVEPDPDKIEISEPELFRNGAKYGVRLHAKASGLHLIRVDIENDIEPLIGTEQQSKDFMTYLNENGEGDDYLNTNLFGKSLYELISDGMQGKGTNMNEQVQGKLHDALQKIANDGCSGMICIML
ncbi:MAG: stage IV sporulation protein A [Clostridia bacterium]|nr:stage IV sporulation protein A [Clostridia bacterium]